MDQLLKDKNHSQQLLYFFLIWMGCFIVFTLLGALLVLIFYGADAYESLAGGLDLASADLRFVKWLQIILSIGIFAVPPLIFVFLKGEDKLGFFKLRGFPDVRYLLMTVMIVFLASPLVYWTLELNQNISFPDFLRGLESYLRDKEEQSEALMRLLLEMNSLSGFALNFLMIALVPAFVEELLFRGTLQRLLQKIFQNPHLAIFLTGAFFGAIHMQFFGSLPRTVLGVLFGYLFYWSGNLWVPVLAHFIHNGTQVVMLYLYEINVVETDIDKIESVPPMLVMVSTVLLFALLFLFDRYSNANKLERLDGKGVG